MFLILKVFEYYPGRKFLVKAVQYQIIQFLILPFHKTLLLSLFDSVQLLQLFYKDPFVAGFLNMNSLVYVVVPVILEIYLLFLIFFVQLIQFEHRIVLFTELHAVIFQDLVAIFYYL
jgi:hypothetical protein